jgi:hypothetical protein
MYKYPATRRVEAPASLLEERKLEVTRAVDENILRREVLLRLWCNFNFFECYQDVDTSRRRYGAQKKFTPQNS